jgi:hypothetical protein
MKKLELEKLIESTIRKVLKEDYNSNKIGITFRKLLDGELALASKKVDFNNYYERNEFIDNIEKRLMENDWISMSNGTTFEKTFTPKHK